jgi:hypothetical protein
MAGDSGGNAEPIPKKEPQLQEQRARNDQRPERHWALAVVVIVVSGVVTIAGLIRPIVNPPHDIVVVAFGIAGVIVGMAIGLYDLVRAWGGMIAVFALLFIAIDVIVADQWISDFRMTHTENPQNATIAQPPPRVAQPQLHGPRFHEVASTFTLTVGHDGPSFSADFHNNLVNLGGFVPFRLSKAADGSIGVNVKVWGGTPNTSIIEINGDDVVIRPPNWDRNMNDNALEIVDQDANPVFQLIRLRPSHFLITGIFPVPGGGFMLAGDHGISYVATVPADFTITPIFRYPSWKYPGVYLHP